MQAFMSVVDVTSQGSYPATPQVNITTFTVGNYLLIIENAAGDGVANVSFDGQTDHGQLAMGKPNQALNYYVEDGQKVWFRKVAGTGTVQVRVMVTKARPLPVQETP